VPAGRACRPLSGTGAVEVPYENGATLPALFLKGNLKKAPPWWSSTHGQLQGDERALRGPGVRRARLEHAGDRRPGQGESLRLRGLYARHDYEVPGRAAYDYVAARPEVDPRKVAVMGYSFGGYYAARIAAFEKRYAAGVAFSALHWDLAAFQRGVKLRQDSIPVHRPVVIPFPLDHGLPGRCRCRASQGGEVLPCRRGGADRMPFLVVHGADDKIVPVRGARAARSRWARKKQLKVFAADEGGSAHALADNRQIAIDYIADWVGANL